MLKGNPDYLMKSDINKILEDENFNVSVIERAAIYSMYIIAKRLKKIEQVLSRMDRRDQERYDKEKIEQKRTRKPSK